MEQNLNRFTGLLKNDKFVISLNGEEKFYLTHLCSYGCDLPVVMSEHYHNEFAGKRVECIAFPKKTRLKPGKKTTVFSYLYCILVQETNEEADSRYVEIEGKVTALQDLELSHNNVVMRKLELECPVNFDKPTIETVPCRIFDQIARQSLAISIGDSIRVHGYVSGGRRSLRVIVQKYDVLK